MLPKYQHLHDKSMFDFGLFLTVTVAISSIFGIAYIGLGTYAVLRNGFEKRAIEKKSDRHRITR
jgi:hypothetical protein